jgi:hypothetical protein
MRPITLNEFWGAFVCSNTISYAKTQLSASHLCGQAKLLFFCVKAKFVAGRHWAEHVKQLLRMLRSHVVRALCPNKGNTLPRLHCSYNYAAASMA